MASCLLTIRGRGKSPALSRPRLSPPRSILRMGQENTGAAEKQKLSTGHGSPRQKDSRVLGGEKPLAHSSPRTPWIQSASAGLLTGSCCLALVGPFFSS